MLSYTVHSGSTLALFRSSFFQNDRPHLIKILGGGRGCEIKVEEPIAGIWITLRGRLQIVGREATTNILAGNLCVIDLDQRSHAIGRSNALWIAVLGSQSAWRDAMDKIVDIPLPEPTLLPAVHRMDRAFRRSAIQLARCDTGETLHRHCDLLVETVVNLQLNFSDAIARCPGRTFAQRRLVFARLQRVRNFMAQNCHLDLNNAQLATMANYSRYHFVRAFNDVFAETPHAYLIKQRLQRATRLLRTSQLGIAEVATASGFENRCAFARLFRQRFGITARFLRSQSACGIVP
jgi:AraC family transcriptional regulator